MLDFLIRADSADNWALVCAALFVVTFIHEDLAIVAAGYFIVEQHMSLPLALATLYIGVVLSDMAVYGLGVGARRMVWLRGYLTIFNTEHASNWVHEHLGLLVTLCRILPGLLFPAFVACGWFAVSPRRFLLYSMLTALPFVGLMLLLVIVFGEHVLQAFGEWGWVLLLAAIVGISWLASRHPKARMFDSGEALSAAGETIHVSSLEGMPPLSSGSFGIRLIELIPDALFYTPVTLYWLWLGMRYRSLTLPTVANPCIVAGGCWGESKSCSLDGIDSSHQCRVAPYTCINRHQGQSPDDATGAAMVAIREAGITFPLIAKPDIGWQGFGVRLIADVDALLTYIAEFPCDAGILLQTYVPYDGEAGVFYMRNPGNEHGDICSLSLVYYPHVIGDGGSTLHQLIMKNPRAASKAYLHRGECGSHGGLAQQDLDAIPNDGEVVRLAMIGSSRLGSIYSDGKMFMTEALSERFDAIARSMPEFYVGRFDIRFKSVESLQRGEDFYILEVNGACSEPLHIWDDSIPVKEKYQELFRAMVRLFEISHENRKRGFKPMPVRPFLALARMQRKLISQYPHSS